MDPAVGEYIPTAGGDNSKLPAGGVFTNNNLSLYHYANNNPVKYTDPTGNDAVLAMVGIAAAVVIGVSYLCLVNNPEYQQSFSEYTNEYITNIKLDIQVAKTAINESLQNSQAKTQTESKAKEETENNDEVTMYHYSETSPEEWKGPLRPDSYITPDIYSNGSEAREKLAIPKDEVTKEEKNIKYRYYVKVKPGDYRAAENSIPGTNTVKEYDGKREEVQNFKQMYH